MQYPAALALILCLCGFASSQEPPAKPAPPPPAPAKGSQAGGAPPAPAPAAPTAPAAPAPPAAPTAPVPAAPPPPVQRGATELSDFGPAGPPTPLPELMARTPDVVRLSTLLGTEVLDLGQSVASLHDFVARKDGTLVALVSLPGGRLVGVPLSGMVARAKPDLEGGSEEATIKSFKLSRVTRRLDASPEVEDESKLGDAWLAKVDAGTPGVSDASAAPESGDTPKASEAGDSAKEPESGAASVASPEAAPLPRLGALLGRTVLDPADKPIGTIVDVVVDVPKARIAYLMVLPRLSTERPHVFRAVPFEALGPDGDEDGVPLTISARALAASPPIRGQARLPVDPFGTSAVSSAQEPR